MCYIYIKIGFAVLNYQKCHVRKRGIRRLNVASGEPEYESSYGYLLPPTTGDWLDELTEGEGAENNVAMMRTLKILSCGTRITRAICGEVF